MCGIAGFVTLDTTPNARPVLERMTSAIAHRGPDDAGFFHDTQAHLGHRRLSIIDLAGGHQPLPNETHDAWIVFNGEIFNHAELRPELESLGHRYRTCSDTETILHAFEQYGCGSVKRLRGMFAYVIWDQSSSRLFAARDRLGIKPFYYFWDGRLFAFASEIKALLEHPAISTVFEDSLLGEHLAFGYQSGEQTMFRGIKKLMPGHHLTLDFSGARPRMLIERYWDVPEASPVTRSVEDAVQETRVRLEEAVRTRLMSDVPLGLFLSGGIDSSAISALVRRMSSGPVKTFAVGYTERRYSELDWASQVAASIGTEHHQTEVSRDDFFQALPRLIWHEDEPVVWPSSVSLYFVSRLAAQHVKVVLTGEGSDELFGGYERYRWTQWNLRGGQAWGLVPAPLRHGLARGLANTSLLRADVRRKLRHTFLGREATIESLLLENFYCAFPSSDVAALLRAPGNSIFESYLHYWNARPADSPLRRMLYADQKTYLVELLMKQDQMSMACSIESRVPFLDHHLVEFAVTLQDSVKIRGGEQKYVLKKAAEDLLPRDIIYRRKMGFPTPLREWLRDPALRPLLDSLLDRDGFLAAYLDRKPIQELLLSHAAGREDATDRLWRLINLQLWGDLFFTGRRERWWNGAMAGARYTGATI